MNTDTQKAETRILKNGYHRQGTTLGGHGWQKIPNDWSKYTLFVNGEEAEYIKAQNDETAVTAFKALYHLDGTTWEIVKSETTHTVITKHTPALDKLKKSRPKLYKALLRR